MLRTIVVPLNGSTFGEQALPWALSLARQAKAAVHIMHVHRALEATYAEMQIFDESLDHQIREQERAYVETMAKKLAGAGVPISGVNQDGEIAPALREYAVAVSADLLVMTTHARGPMARFWLGSVADESLRDAPCPILLVHPHDQAVDLQQAMTIKNILVPLDGSPFAEQVLELALSLGKLYGAAYALLRVIQPIQAMTMPVGAGSFGEMAHRMMERLDVLQEQLRKEAQEYLDGVAARLRAQGLTVTTQVATAEQPGVAILQHARPPVDLIALETHGRRGLARLFLGSVADKVVRGATVPVLVHRPRHV
jgi:nucleotide-binding universal stress UspA family protein